MSNTKGVKAVLIASKSWVLLRLLAVITGFQGREEVIKLKHKVPLKHV